MPALLLLTGPSAGLRYELKGEVVLGRSPSCEIPLEDSKVSRRHAKIVAHEGQSKLTDLGSRNGTLVNGEKIEAETIMLPGDRFQIGDSTVLYEPAIRAALTEKNRPEQLFLVPIEELLPAVGPQGALYSAGVALLSAANEAMVLRRAAQELGRSVNADRAAALLGGMEGLLTAAVIGADAVEVPRAMVQAALERREISRAGGALCAPLIASGGAPFGILYAERPEPFALAEALTIAALGRLAGEAFAAVRSRSDFEGPLVQWVGTSRQFRKTIEQSRRAASAAEPVVVFGETGSGRLHTAKYIHTRSPRALGPWVVVDCGQSATHVEEDLLGRGSAPGVPPMTSALLRADGGTLVLRHLELLPPFTAKRVARLLRGKVAPARQGGEEAVDFRVMATANAQPSALAQRGEIDSELADVLTGLEIESLPLRERRPDVFSLYETFAGQAARSQKKEPPSLSPDAKRLLSDYAWPGNVSELKAVSERLALLYSGVEVPALALPIEVQEGGSAPATRTLPGRVARLERDLISEALREARGKKIKAAALLGISRPTLDKKIADYHLVVEKRPVP